VIAGAGGEELRAAGVAEAFARAYMSYDPADPGRRAGALGALVAGHLDGDAGVTLPDATTRRVAWSGVVDYAPVGPRAALVTVAVQLAGAQSAQGAQGPQSAQSARYAQGASPDASKGVPQALWYLAVPVTWTAAGQLAVADYPSFVGGPAHTSALSAPDGDPVADTALAAVAARALRNYLAGFTDDLAADLDRGVIVTTPARGLRLDSVDSLVWLDHEEVGATVTAADAAGATYTLRYRLGVVRRDRWYVRGIGDSTPTTRRRW
jgi:hypothetical protein